MVEFIDWEPYYLRILRSFQFSREEDEASAHQLSTTLPHPRLPVSALEEMLQGKTVVICGAHERLHDDFECLDFNGRTEFVLLAADGACSALREIGIRPDLILTDLDGSPEDLVYWNSSGVPLIVHAHGDNRDRIAQMAQGFVNSMATTQSAPFDDVHNFGGFTDGDRCVFLADHFGAFRMILIGFDFEKVGKYSFFTDEERKLRKLKWARELISLFEIEYPIQETL